jgi:hypothetical protein
VGFLIGKGTCCFAEGMCCADAMGAGLSRGCAVCTSFACCSFKGARSGVTILRSGSVSGASRNGERRVEALATHDFVNSVF